MSVRTPSKITSSVNVDERKNLDVRAGDIVRIHQKIQEKGKTRIQLFEGLVIARKHGSEAGATFTVRATLSGIGVEKIFPLYSPAIDKIEVVRRSKMPRAKLYYIRDKAAREQRRSLRNMIAVAISTTSEREEAERTAKEAEAAAAKAEEERKAIEAKAAEKAAQAAAEAAKTAEASTAPEEPKEEKTEA